MILVRADFVGVSIIDNESVKANFVRPAVSQWKAVSCSEISARKASPPGHRELTETLRKT